MTGSGHDAVLAWAAASRARREELVAALTSGRTDLAAVLAARADPLVGAVKLVVLVQAVPGVGKVVARRVLASLGLADALVGELDDQRGAQLLDALLSGSVPPIL